MKKEIENLQAQLDKCQKTILREYKKNREMKEVIDSQNKTIKILEAWTDNLEKNNNHLDSRLSEYKKKLEEIAPDTIRK